MENDPLVALRRDPFFARSLQFLRFFHPAFPSLLPPLGGHQPEAPLTPARLVVGLECLLAFETDLARLSFPFFALLKPFHNNLRHSSVWECTVREYGRRGIAVPTESGGLLEMSVGERARVLCDLCEFHMENADVFRRLWEGRVRDGEREWRIDPLGADSSGRSYYVFGDGRLYREGKGGGRGRGGEGCWELLAASLKEWEFLLDNGTKCTLLNLNSRKNRQLFEYLQAEILPEVAKNLEEIEREERKVLRSFALQSIPRKRSSRLQALRDTQLRHAAEEARETGDGVASDIEAPSEQKTSSREERLRERELKKMMRYEQQHQQQQDESDAIDVSASAEAASDLATAILDNSSDSLTQGSSPLKLVLKRREDGSYESSLITAADSCSAYESRGDFGDSNGDNDDKDTFDNADAIKNDTSKSDATSGDLEEGAKMLMGLTSILH